MVVVGREPGPLTGGVEIAPQLEVRVARRAIAGVTQEPEPEEAEEAEEAEETEESDQSEEPEDTPAGSESEADSTGAIAGGEAPVEEDRG